MNGIQTTKYNNCSHNLDKYYEGIFIKDDYCDNCLDKIESNPNLDQSRQ